MSSTDSGFAAGRSRWLLLSSLAFALAAAGGLAACGNDGTTSSGTPTSGSGAGANGAGGDAGGNSGGAAAAGGQGGEGFSFGGNSGVTDADGDGISDEDEGKDAPNGPTDTDGDGTPDYLDDDSDGDGLSDKIEGIDDYDGDGIPNFQDSFNDGPPPTLKLIAIVSTAFNNPIGIDYHEPTNSLVLSANYPTGSPLNFERIEQDGTHQPFSTMSGLTNEVKIATARPNNVSGFTSGELFVGNGLDGQIARISPDGATITNPWVDLPGAGNGLLRGSLVVDHQGVLFGGDLIGVTTSGQVWRIDAAGVATMIASAPGVHLEGVAIVPDAPIRYGPLAGKIIAGAEAVGLLYSFAADGTTASYTVGVNVEDIDMVLPNENFFGVNYGSGNLYGAEAAQFLSMHGDILLTQETHSGTGLYRLQWDGQALVTQELPITADSAVPAQWEHVTFAAAGVAEIPTVRPPK